MNNRLTEELARLVTSGPVEFIFSAEQAISLIDACGSDLDFAAAKNFGELFGTIQGMGISQFVLSLTKLYEQPSKRYPNLSLPSVLQFVADNADALPISEHQLVQRGLEFLGSDPTAFLEATSAPDRNRALVSALLTKLPELSKSDSLRALKTLRDKQIAHPEDISADQIGKTTWQQAEKLLEVPRGAVGIIGDAYLSTAYWDAKWRYLPSEDGFRAGRAMRRLIKLAKG